MGRHGKKRASRSTTLRLGQVKLVTVVDLFTLEIQRWHVKMITKNLSGYCREHEWIWFSNIGMIPLLIGRFLHVTPRWTLWSKRTGSGNLFLPCPRGCVSTWPLLSLNVVLHLSFYQMGQGQPAAVEGQFYCHCLNVFLAQLTLDDFVATHVLAMLTSSLRRLI